MRCTVNISRTKFCKSVTWSQHSKFFLMCSWKNCIPHISELTVCSFLSFLWGGGSLLVLFGLVCFGVSVFVLLCFALLCLVLSMLAVKVQQTPILIVRNCGDTWADDWDNAGNIRKPVERTLWTSGQLAQRTEGIPGFITDSMGYTSAGDWPTGHLDRV